jgi:hypothetical protein
MNQATMAKSRQPVRGIPLVADSTLYLGDSPRRPLLHQEVQDLFVKPRLVLFQVH